MNLQNYNKEGRNYRTEKIRQISPSSKLIHLSNQETSFYISKYGDPQENSKDTENTKYLMSLIQPLLEENYQLKDTIINLTEALKLDKELIMKTISQIVKDQIFPTDYTISDLLDCLTKCVQQDRQIIIQQKEIIKNKDIQIEELQNKIQDFLNWKSDFIKQKNQEVEQQVKDFFEKMNKLELYNLQLEDEKIQLENQIQEEKEISKKLDQQLGKTISNVNELTAQKQEMQLQLCVAERLLHQEKQEAQKRLNESVSQLNKDHFQQIEQMKIDQVSQINDYKKQIQDLNEEIKNLELSYTASLDKNLYEVKRLQQALKEAEKNLSVYKRQELTNLDSLSKTMIEKRDKDQKLKQLNNLISEKDSEIENLKLELLSQKSKQEQTELKCTQQVQKYKKKYKEKIQVKVETAKKELEQKVVVVEQEKKKISEEFKQQIIILDVQKTSLVKECKADNDKLREEIEDLEFKLKDLDNMWDFKYAKLKMEYDRLKLELNQQ